MPFHDLGTKLLERQHNYIVAQATHVGKAVDGPVEIVNWWHQEYLRDRRDHRETERKAMREFIAMPEGKAAHEAWLEGLGKREPPTPEELEKQAARIAAYKRANISRGTLNAVSATAKLLGGRGEPAGAEAITAFLRGAVDLETVELAMEEITKIHHEARVHQADVTD